MTSSWRLRAADEERVDGEFDFALYDGHNRRRAELFKFVCDGTSLLAVAAPNGDRSVMHADLITKLEATHPLACRRENVILGWIWIEEPDAVYELAYGEPDAALERWLLRWLEHGRPSTLIQTYTRSPDDRH